jgi:hypothetical protein
MKHSSLPDTIRRSLRHKRELGQQNDHHKLRAKPLYHHQHHETKMDKNLTALARHPTKPPTSRAKKAPCEVQILSPRLYHLSGAVDTDFFVTGIVPDFTRVC